ncbi:GIY-YIG nuclease family protein [Thiocapsa rosea]|uniref:GIY-YIG catalytic domain-containing protein n=1 Tax=Thiocapsa rosea TaxID=69360 RepID=A0A495UNP4_9GAMM|nr:GIY-YIG nuclease family protein [Thiocapsa rosea]RKT37855.1 hypothetical protein BDD21_5365 [Thiocapsa rosea]
MVQQPTLTIPGASRTQYPFTLFPWGTAFRRFGAVYVVLRRQHDGRYQLLYVGQTMDMSERFLAHHKLACFQRYGQTHIGVFAEPSEARQRAIERDLIAAHQPPCNG